MPWIVRTSRAFMAAALFSVFIVVGAVAQGVTTGAITGWVTDERGQPVDAASVQVVNRSTGYTSSTRTRANGLYLVQGLEIGGPYTITIRGIGHQPYVHDDVYVKLSEATRVDAVLKAQAVELAAVSVIGAATPDFAPTRQGTGTQISATLVSHVPTFSRDFVSLLKLSPQVVYPASGAPSGAGAYNRYNTITIDGANQSERFNLGATNGVPGGSANGKIVSIDAVKEFRVMFTPSDVRQGNFAGMLVNAVTKNGTNEFQGGASFTYRSNKDFLGLELVGKSLRPSKFDVEQYSFYLGGPIIRDRLHFFIAPEFQERTSPAGGPYYLGTQGGGSPAPVIPLDSLTRIAAFMDTAMGFNVGATGPVDRDNPLKNLFGRLDFQISSVHRFVLRQIINHADLDEFSRSNTTYNNSPLNQNSGFRFGSNAFSRVAKNNSTVAQLYSNLSNGMSNELIFGYSTIRDERSVPVTAPEIGVGVNISGTVNGVTFGTEQFSPNNLLDQKITELVDNFTIPMGNHTFTVGGRFDHTHIFNNFAQGSYGVYTFPTIAALEARTPSGYAVGYANSGRAQDIPADFRIRVYSLYGQDQWRITDRLTITAGLRTDIPKLLDRPPQNDTLTAALAAAGLPGVRTDVIPKTRALLSPRVGFNYDPTADNRNQIRGSIGIYTGPPPYILLGNAYANTGLGLVRLSCTVAGSVPTFTVDVASLPKACQGQPAPLPGQAGTVGVNVTDPDFKYPQYFGVSAGFDRQLPSNTVLTVEAMYRKAINGVLVRDADIKGPRLVGGQPYTDRDGRVLYADTINANGSVPFSRTFLDQRYLDSLRHVGFNEGIIQVTNQSKDFNYSISAQLNRRFSDRFEATLAYTYMKSEDVQSLTSDRAISNWRNGRQLAVAHEDLVTTTSVFSRPHRLLAYGTYTFPWQNATTDLTVYYERSSGVPYSYVANGDLNGDLYNGNDLLYIPRDATNPSEMRIGTGTGANFVQNLAAAQAFQRFIDAQPCLAKQRGHIMERNSCRTPSQDRLDVSVRQSIPQFRGQRLAVQLDIFNFLNFLNRDWGQIKLPTLSPTFNDQRALSVSGRNPGPLNQSIPTFTFNGSLYQSNPAKPDFGKPLPFEGRDTQASAYNVQLTLRYSF